MSARLRFLFRGSRIPRIVLPVRKAAGHMRIISRP